VWHVERPEVADSEFGLFLVEVAAGRVTRSTGKLRGAKLLVFSHTSADATDVGGLSVHQGKSGTGMIVHSSVYF